MSSQLYPVKNAQGEVDGVKISVSVSGFQDKIVVMVWTDGKIGRMLTVGLSPSLTGIGNAIRRDLDQPDADSEALDMMPSSHLDVKPLIGSSSQYDSAGPLFASMIASVVSKQAPAEPRSLVVGLGPHIGPKPGNQNDSDFGITNVHRQQLLEVVRLVQQCRVW